MNDLSELYRTEDEARLFNELREQVEKLETWEKVKKEHGDAVTDKVMSEIVVEELLSLKKHLDDKAKEKKKSK